MIDHAIRNTYPSVVSIKVIDNDNYSATDENDNEVALDATVISVELAKLQAKYDALEYARNRQAEYPSIADLVVALYDTDDKSAIETKRAEVKAKYPKPE